MKFQLRTFLIGVAVCSVVFGLFVRWEWRRRENLALANALATPSGRIFRDTPFEPAPYNNDELLAMMKLHEHHRDESPYDTIYLGAMWRLGHREDPRVEPFAEALLDDWDERRRAAAIQTLLMANNFVDDIYWSQKYENHVGGDTIDSPGEAIAVSAYVYDRIQFGSLYEYVFDEIRSGPIVLTALNEVGAPEAAKTLERVFEIGEIVRAGKWINDGHLDLSVDAQGRGIEAELQTLDRQLANQLTEEMLLVYLVRHRKELSRFRFPERQPNSATSAR